VLCHTGPLQGQGAGPLLHPLPSERLPLASRGRASAHCSAVRKAFVGHDEAATCEDYDLFAKAEDVVARPAAQNERGPKATFHTAARSIWD
jgi:hypothetical protein